jgi:hypothetical protein
MSQQIDKRRLSLAKKRRNQNAPSGYAVEAWAAEDERRHREIEESFWRRSFRLSVVTTVAAVAAALFAGYALKASWDSLDEAREDLRSNRAWLTVNAIPAINDTAGDVDGKPFKKAIEFLVQWVNTGRSPALKIHTWTTYSLQDRGAFKLPVFKQPNRLPHVQDAVAGPNMLFGSHSNPITDDDLDSLISHKKRLVVYAVVEYRDVFTPNVRRSEACYEIYYGGEASTGQINWIFFSVGPQNTAN